MGHAVNHDRQYRLLQQRLDRQISGAPDSPVFQRILRLVFSPADAELACKVPARPTASTVLARRLGTPQAELEPRLADMARRGLLVDLEHGGRRYFALPPVVIGFFEFVFMRIRDDVPQAELARLFEQYMWADDRFARAVFEGETAIARSLVREESLPEEPGTEILDWERATQIVASASAVAVSLCVCRHKAAHLGRACDRPQRCCMSLNYAAESLIRIGNAEAITTAEALRMLEECKQAGLVQTADNVQRKPTFICNCCRCCCGLMQGVRDFSLRTTIATSNWISVVDDAACKGCGRCAEVCPVEAIQIVPRDGESEGDRHSFQAEAARKLSQSPACERSRGGKHAVVDPAICLGCGLCRSVCKLDAVHMQARPQRVLTPETVFDRMIAMAVERGKLADLIFPNPQRLSHRALGRVFTVLERSPVFKAAMAIRPLRSAFLDVLVRKGRQAMGDLAGLMG